MRYYKLKIKSSYDDVKLAKKLAGFFNIIAMQNNLSPREVKKLYREQNQLIRDGIIKITLSNAKAFKE